jgi:GTP-binding protein HflX
MLLLHVIDASDPHRSERIAQVNAVLAEVGACDIPQVEIFNKADLVADRALDSANVESCDLDRGRVVARCWVSARTGAGVGDLITAISVFLGPQIVQRRLVLGATAGRARARLYDVGAVVRESTNSAGEAELDISMPLPAFERFCRDEGLMELLPQDQRLQNQPAAAIRACVA